VIGTASFDRWFTRPVGHPSNYCTKPAVHGQESNLLYKMFRLTYFIKNIGLSDFI